MEEKKIQLPNIEGELYRREKTKKKFFTTSWNLRFIMVICEKLYIAKDEKSADNKEWICKVDISKVEIFETVLTNSKQRYTFKLVESIRFGEIQEHHFAVESEEELRELCKNLQTLSSYWKKKFLREQALKENEIKELENNEKVHDNFQQTDPNLFNLQITMFCGNVRSVQLPKDGRFDQLFYALAKADGCPNCETCQQRAKYATLYVINQSKQVLHVEKDEEIYIYHRAGCTFVLSEHKKKPLVVYLEGGSVLVCVVDDDVTAEQLLNMDVIAKEVNNLKMKSDVENVGVFFKEKGDSEGKRFLGSEKILQFFYDENGNPISEYGDLIIKNDVLRKATISSNDIQTYLSRIKQAGERRARLKDEDIAKQEIENCRSLRRPTNISENADDISTNLPNYKKLPSGRILATDETRNVSEGIHIPHHKPVSPTESVCFDSNLYDPDTCLPLPPVSMETLSSSDSSSSSFISTNSSQFVLREVSAVTRNDDDTENEDEKVDQDPMSRPTSDLPKVFYNPNKRKIKQKEKDADTAKHTAEAHSAKATTIDVLTSSNKNEDKDEDTSELHVNENEVSSITNEFCRERITTESSSADVAGDTYGTKTDNVDNVDNADGETLCIPWLPQDAVTVKSTRSRTASSIKRKKVINCSICHEMTVDTRPHEVNPRLMDMLIQNRLPQVQYICLGDVHLRQIDRKWIFADDTQARCGLEDSWDEFLSSNQVLGKKFNLNGILCQAVMEGRKHKHWMVKRVGVVDVKQKEDDTVNDIHSDNNINEINNNPEYNDVIDKNFTFEKNTTENIEEDITSPREVEPDHVIMTHDGELQLENEEEDGDEKNSPTKDLLPIDLDTIKNKFLSLAEGFKRATTTKSNGGSPYRSTECIFREDQEKQDNSLEDGKTIEKIKAMTKKKMSLTLTDISNAFSKIQYPEHTDPNKTIPQGEWIMSEELIAIRERYIQPLKTCIQKICQILATKDLNELYKLANDYQTPSIGHIVRKELCTILANFLTIGLSPSRQVMLSLFNKPVTHWRLIKEFSISFRQYEFQRVIERIEMMPTLTDDNMKFRQFICELLNHSSEEEVSTDEKLLVTFFKLFPLETDCLARFYARNSFWKMKKNPICEEIVVALKQFNGLPFVLHSEFEYRFYKNENPSSRRELNGHTHRNKTKDVLYMLE